MIKSVEIVNPEDDPYVYALTDEGRLYVASHYILIRGSGEWREIRIPRDKDE